MVQYPSILKRTIPSSGQQIPVVGIGTWQTFDVNHPGQYPPLRNVLISLLSGGGTVVDSSPMYGESEHVIGDLSTELGINQDLFLATKVWTTGKDDGIRQMNRSMALLKRTSIELMQIHNLVDWKTHLKTLREWKEKGKIQYLGITHYSDSAHDKVGEIIRNHPVDFLQINYSLTDRHAGIRLLPLAQEHGVAVLINRPLSEGRVFKHVLTKALPEWANDLECTSWSQLFLKFILANPAVTCVIPATANPDHMQDNLAAGTGRLPDHAQLEKMIRHISNL